MRTGRVSWERGTIVALLALVGALVAWGVSCAPRVVATTSTTDAGHLAAEEFGGTVSVSGHLEGSLAPGRGEAIDLRVANRGDDTWWLDRVVVSVRGVHAPRGGAGSCDVDDFEVRQGDVRGVVVAPGRVVRLSEAGVSRERWPRLWMLDRAHNQDGCKDAVVRLAFAAEGSAR